MEKNKIADMIAAGEAVLGIELGSTRIKSVLVGTDCAPLAAGSYDWENEWKEGVWTYSLKDVWKGLSCSYRSLAEQVKDRYGTPLKRVRAMGVSAMMHGYLAFDENGELLTPFRTWRNTMTEEAAEELTREFKFNIPQRWSVAHLYQAVKNREEHVGRIRYLTTLSGYVHQRLTGQKVLGVGDASGMFPIDSRTGNFNCRMMEAFDGLIAKERLPWRLEQILPKVLTAGAPAGALTEEGARLLDVSGMLEPGIPLCPPEGDAGTGMAATNSVRPRTGNVSAGTSVFAMLVLEQELSRVYREIDLVTTPDGSCVAMVHCNNGTSDLTAWVRLFGEFTDCLGVSVDQDRLYSLLYQKALEGDDDCGGLLAYNYVSGEHITGMNEGRPLFTRLPDARFHLANFMRTHLYTSLGALKMGLDLLQKEERVAIDRIYGHGGFFKTKGVGQRILAAAIKAPVTVLDTAGEGGAWGIALLASYLVRKEPEESLSHYLETKVFGASQGEELKPQPGDVSGFEAFMERYQSGLAIERAAVESLK